MTMSNDKTCYNCDHWTREAPDDIYACDEEITADNHVSNPLLGCPRWHKIRQGLTEKDKEQIKSIG